MLNNSGLLVNEIGSYEASGTQQFDTGGIFCSMLKLTVIGLLK